jgi:peptidoglycan hydrolase-like protein with peptidoglycan-binding domain
VPAAEADKPTVPSARIAAHSARSSQAALAERDARPLEARLDDRIWRLQAALARRGFYRGPLDGLASPRTIQAIRGYQLSLRDPPSGVLTQIEIVRLLNNW